MSLLAAGVWSEKLLGSAMPAAYGQAVGRGQPQPTAQSKTQQCFFHGFCFCSAFLGFFFVFFFSFHLNGAINTYYSFSTGRFVLTYSRCREVKIPEKVKVSSFHLRRMEDSHLKYAKLQQCEHVRYQHI